MEVMSGPTRISDVMSDEEIVMRVLGGETGLFELIMRRHNQRLYRTVRAILRDEAQAEDVVQDTYVRAYAHLDQFGGRASFATWLTRIAVHESLARIRSGKRFQADSSSLEVEGDRMDQFSSPSPDPEQQASTAEIRTLLEKFIDALPDGNRAVFMMRDVDGMSTTETAYALGVTEMTVKVRLHRARAALRKQLSLHAIACTPQAFAFGAARCDSVVNAVLEIISRMPAITKTEP